MTKRVNSENAIKDEGNSMRTSMEDETTHVGSRNWKLVRNYQRARKWQNMMAERTVTGIRDGTEPNTKQLNFSIQAVGLQ